MIHGLHIDIPAATLSERIDRRVTYHERQARLGKAQLDSLRVSDADIEPRSSAQEIPGFVRPSPRDVIARRVADHERRAELLTFMKEHLVQGETYRLSDRDLEIAELLPKAPPRW